MCSAAIFYILVENSDFYSIYLIYIILFNISPHLCHKAHPAYPSYFYILVEISLLEWLLCPCFTLPLRLR